MAYKYYNTTNLYHQIFFTKIKRNFLYLVCLTLIKKAGARPPFTVLYQSAALFPVILSITLPGTSKKCENCIVKTPRPCVRDLKSVAYPNISASGTVQRTT